MTAISDGVYPAMVTPFTDDLRVDYDALPPLLRRKPRAGRAHTGLSGHGKPRAVRAIPRTTCGWRACPWAGPAAAATHQHLRGRIN